MRREKLPSWRWPHMCIYTHVCKQTHTRIHGHTCCAPQHKYISPPHHHHWCFSYPAGEGPRRSRPPPRAGMAYLSFYLRIPFPLLGPPGRSIHSSPNRLGEPYYMPGTGKKPKFEEKEKREGRRERSNMYTAVFTQKSMYWGVCVRVHAHMCAHVHSRAYKPAHVSSC